MPARAASLARYHKKRDFSKTPEPRGRQGKKAGRRYLIQKHAATRLHYDFRLELDGVLKSWAVTRGPSLDPADKRLAVEVEDHPLEYGSFEGSIPKGQYGGGTVMLWDEGVWEPIGDAREGLKKGKLEFLLHGRRLRGEWTLVRMKGREEDRGRHNWLLIKHRDKEARPGDADRLLAEHTTSVVSKRSMEKIAAAKDRVWQSSSPRRGEVGRGASTAQSLRSSRKRPHPTPPPMGEGKRMPSFRPPQLATLTTAMPQGNNWVHEIKFDGYRALSYLHGGRVRIFTRNRNDWTHKFPSLAARLSTLPVKSAILDGEIVAIGENEASSFKGLQNVMSDGGDDTLQYYLFDLLYLNGKDLTRLPLLERKKKLAALLARPPANIFYSEHVTTPDTGMLARLCGMGLEGVVSKRADAPYTGGRGVAWLKTKCHRRQEFVIGGFTQPTHAERGIGALLIGYWEGKKFRYAGKVGTGFDHTTSLSLRRRLDWLARKTPAFDEVPADGRRGATWVTPSLVCEVEFTEWTPDGRLRHPSFQGLREDKPAAGITRDVPVAKPVKTSSKASENGRQVVGGLAISHPGRIIYPGTGITKAQLAEYYLEIADRILPHVKNRPLSMVRCPEGTGEECFFQRHMAHGTEHIYDTGIAVKGRKETYLMIKDIKGLLALVQWGAIELHPWGCLADKPDRPDRIIFDLDPDPALPFAHVIEGVREVRERMHELGLVSFLKTTGGKGLHVVIPLARRYGWPTVKAFARAVSESMQHDRPERYIARASKAARKNKIFVDYLRNDLTATAVAPYSARAREGAPVALPLTWEDLKLSLKPKIFTIETVPARLRRRKDPWQDFFKVKQQIASAHLRALGIEPE